MIKACHQSRSLGLVVSFSGPLRPLLSPLLDWTGSEETVDLGLSYSYPITYHDTMILEEEEYLKKRLDWDPGVLFSFFGASAFCPFCLPSHYGMYTWENSELARAKAGFALGETTTSGRKKSQKPTGLPRSPASRLGWES